MARFGSVLVLATCALALSAGPAAALTPTITEFSSGLKSNAIPMGIGAGPDGNVWFTAQGSSPGLGVISPTSHAISEFGSSMIGAYDIVAGPDGNLWFTDCGGRSAIGKVDPSTRTITEYAITTSAGGSTCPNAIVAGPDGNLWFTDSGGAIGLINPHTHTISEFGASDGLNTGAVPWWITVGPDGNLWFTDSGTPAIGTINPSTDKITEFNLGSKSRPSGIAAGPDRNVWFTDGKGAIGRVNPSTDVVTEFSSGLNSGSYPAGIAEGPDGQLWFTDNGVKPAIGMIDPATHAIAEFSSGLTSSNEPWGIALGPDGNMWFTDEGSFPHPFCCQALGRITTSPVAITGKATPTGPHSATLSGTVNGHAQPTSFHVEFGPVGGATKVTAERSLGTTAGNAPISATLAGLKPGTAYRARVVATNPTGTTDGQYVTFSMPAIPTLKTSGRISVKLVRGVFVVDPGIKLMCPTGGKACGASEVARLTTSVAVVQAGKSVGRAHFTIAAGGNKELSLRLNKLGARLLGQLKSLHVTVTVIARVGHYSPITTIKIIQLKAP